jgi:hypothetical protein
MIMEVIFSSNTSVLRRHTRRHIPDDGNLLSHSSENLKSYTMRNLPLLYMRIVRIRYAYNSVRKSDLSLNALSETNIDGTNIQSAEDTVTASTQMSSRWLGYSRFRA